MAKNPSKSPVKKAKSKLAIEKLAKSIKAKEEKQKKLQMDVKTALRSLVRKRKRSLGSDASFMILRRKVNFKTASFSKKKKTDTPENSKKKKTDVSIANKKQLKSNKKKTNVKSQVLSTPQKLLPMKITPERTLRSESASKSISTVTTRTSKSATPAKRSFDFVSDIDKILEETSTPKKPETFLEKEFPDDSSSDEEYKPNEDELNELDDTLESKSQTEEVELSERLKNLEDTSQPLNEQDHVFYMTRSKVSYTDKPLEDFEQAFIPPDIDQDMYDCVIDDQDWKEFLTEFTKPIDRINTNEDDDTEFIPNLHEDEVDSEELRRDSGVKVSKKELNELMGELFDFSEIYDYGNDKCEDAHINDYVNLKFNETFINDTTLVETTPRKETKTGKDKSKDTPKKVTFSDNNSSPGKNINNSSKKKILKNKSNNIVNNEIVSDVNKIPHNNSEPNEAATNRVNNSAEAVASKQIETTNITDERKEVDVEENPNIGEETAKIQQPKIRNDKYAKYAALTNREYHELYDAYVKAIQKYKTAHGITHDSGISYHDIIHAYGASLYGNDCNPVNQNDSILTMEYDENICQSNSQRSVETHNIGVENKTTTSARSENSRSEPSTVLFEADDLSLLKQQINQHIQYATQHYLQTFNHPHLSKLAKPAKNMIETFYNQSLKHPISYFNSLNIKPAMEIVKTWEGIHSNDFFRNYMYKEWDKTSSAWRSFKDTLALPKAVIDQILASKVFIYPLLLPKKSFEPKHHLRFICPLEMNSELNLIIYGLINYSHILNNDTKYDKFKLMMDVMSAVQRNYCPAHTARYLTRRVMDFFKSKQSNVLKTFFESGQLEFIEHFILEYNEDNVMPPCRQPANLLPLSWKNYVR